MWLIKLSYKINPQERLSNIESVDNYEARKLGVCLVLTKKEIKDYRKKNKVDEGWSNRKAVEMLVKPRMRYASQSSTPSIKKI